MIERKLQRVCCVGLCRACASFAMLFALAPPARAQEARDPRAAQALFDEARKLIDRGETSRACALLEESQRLDPAGGTLLNLAVCHETSGRLATAWVEYKESLGLALRDGREDRVLLARQAIARVEPLLPRVRIAGGDTAPSIALFLDGAPATAAAFALGVPVDPGEHALRASAPGRVSWTQTFTLRAGEVHEIVVPPLLPLPVAAPLSTSNPSSSVTEKRQSSFGAGTYAFGGVAIASFAVAGVSGWLALDAERRAESKCVSARDYCFDPTYADDATSARTLAWTSTVALGVGIAATVTAIVWPRVPRTTRVSRVGSVTSLRFEF